MKRLLRRPAARALIAWLGALYIRLVYHTTRWRWVGLERLEPYFAARQAVIICFWHGRLMLMPYLWRSDMPMHVLISRHRDGQMISRTIRHLGIGTVAGSSSRGGVAAFRGMLGAVAKGSSLAITPDGPRGPRMRAAPGVAKVAALTGLPVFPAAFATTRRRLLPSWDRFLLAAPLGRGAFVIGEPIQVPRDADAGALEAARLAVEERLNAVTAEADRLCGHAPVEPAPLPPAEERG